MYLGLLSDVKFVIWSIFAIINFLSFYAVFTDKRKAIKNIQRIPEINFFLWGVFGGSLGILFGMYFFRHKTRKWYFLLGFSMLFLENIIFCLKLIEILNSL